MDDELTNPLPPDAGQAEQLTEQEREFIIKVVTDGVQFQGSYSNLVPTMNIVQSIIRKLSNNVA